jgi:hypothetical protein
MVSNPLKATMTPTITPVTLYKHPDGFVISYAEKALIASDDESNFVVMPIGKTMLLDLAKKLYDIANKMKDRP